MGVPFMATRVFALIWCGTVRPGCCFYGPRRCIAPGGAFGLLQSLALRFTAILSLVCLSTSL